MKTTIFEAFREFIARHRWGRVTERLDAIYGAEPAQVEMPLKAGQRRAMRQDRW